MKGADDYTLVLMKATEMDAVYPAAFHIGFMLETSKEVIELYNQLKSGNVTLAHEPKKIRDSFGFYFRFDMLMIEVGHFELPDY
ncbi:MAG TPA: hypothetical protein VLB84_03830 [Bacteroidia bacterium]|nr:hypothetical protein [Bacteroidia bacterium]